MPRLPCALLASLALLVSCARGNAPAGPPPNILVLLVDCLRADRYGAATPHHRPATPNLDRLVGNGTSFTRAFVQASWTRPSVPSILTGLYPSEHGLGAFTQRGAEVFGSGLSQAAVTLAEGLKALGYPTALIGQQNQLAPRFGLDQGFDYYNHKSAHATRIHRRFFEWLEAEPGRPFFAYLHYLELHWPYCPPASTRGQFTAGYSGRPLCHQWRQLREDLRSGAVVLTPAELEALQGFYDEELLGLDLEIGQLFDGLARRGLWENTLIVVTSDHGEEFFEHGGMAHGGSLHDELIAVPLVFKPPAHWEAPRGRKVDALVELRDLAPTLLEAGGASLGEALAGRSLMPWILGGEGQERPFVVAEHQSSVAVRTRDMKLIVNRDAEDELYDLLEDPGETRNVSRERPADVARLESHLREWRSSLEPVPPSDQALDQETIEGLRNLGYLD